MNSFEIICSHLKSPEGGSIHSSLFEVSGTHLNALQLPTFNLTLVFTGTHASSLQSVWTHSYSFEFTRTHSSSLEFIRIDFSSLELPRTHCTLTNQNGKGRSGESKGVQMVSSDVSWNGSKPCPLPPRPKSYKKLTEIKQHKHCRNNCHQTPKWKSKGSQHGPQIHPKPEKFASGASLRRAFGKKRANIKSVQDLLCFNNNQAFPTTSLFANVSVPNWSWSLSGRGLKNNLQSDTTFLSKLSEKGLQKDPKWTPR